MKKRISLLIIGILIFTSFTAFGADKAQKLDAWFYNIKVVINGQTLSTPLQPFIYNNNTYVPLRPIVEGMGGTPTWDDATKTITIKNTSSDEVLRLKNEISALNFEVNNSKAQLKTKDDKIKELEDKIKKLDDDDDDDDDDKDLDDLEDNLEDDYDSYSDGSKKMEFSYSLSQSSKTVKVKIETNFSKSDAIWQDRSKSGFQGFIENIAEEIHDDNNFDDYDIEITVYDEDNKKIGEYSYDEGDDDFNVDDEY